MSDRRPDRMVLDAIGPARDAWDNRREYRGLEREHRLNAREIEALRTVGTFRAIEAKDLDPNTVASLQKEDLLDRATVYPERRRGRGDSLKTAVRPLDVVTLSLEGREVMSQEQGIDDPQRLYSGFVKPQELAHDCAGYRAFLDEKERIEATGGQIKRVVLDFELKGLINSIQNRSDDPAEARKELARELELPLMNGRVMIPDVRLEYQDEHGAERHVDIEVITRHYKGSHMSSKRASGFRLHDMHRKDSKEKAGGRGKVIYQQDLGFI